MKNRNTVLAILLFLMINSFSFSVIAQENPLYTTPDGLWTWRSPTPFGGDFNTVCALDGNNMIVGGDWGIVLKADVQNVQDIEWEQQFVPASFIESTKDIEFHFDNTNGYLISNNMLLETSDAGTQWQLYPGTVANIDTTVYDFVSLSYSDTDEVFLFAKETNGNGVLVASKTIDGSWDLLPGIPSGIIGFNYPYYWDEHNIYEYDASTVVSDVSGTITEVASVYDNLSKASDCLFIVEDGGSATLYKNDLSYDIGEEATTSTGITANEHGFNPLGARITAVDQDKVFVYSTPLYVFENEYQDYRRDVDDAGFDGLNLAIKAVASNAGNPLAIAVTEKAYIYAATSSYWNPSVEQIKINVEWSRCVDFTSALYGYIIQSDNPNDTTVTYRTTDGGITWDSLAIINSGLQNLDKFFVLPDNSKSYIMDGEGVVYSQLINNGNLTDYIIEAEDAGLKADFFFIDHEKGFMLTQDNKLLMTNSANLQQSDWEYIYNFNEYPNINERKINSMYFPNSDVGFVTGGYEGGDGILLYTSDGGYSWETIITGGPEILEVDFISENIGFLVGYEGVIHRTLDGGMNVSSWKPIQLKYDNGTGMVNVNEEFRTFEFWDAEMGYIVTSKGMLCTDTLTGLDVNQNDPNIEDAELILKRSPLNFEVGHLQKTPSLYVLGYNFDRFIYSRGENTLTSDGFDNMSNVGTIYAGNGSGVIVSLPPVPGEDPLSYTVNISGLTSNLIVEAPDQFLISKDPYSSTSWASTLIYAYPDELENSPITIWVQFVGSGGKNDDVYRAIISHRSEGAIPTKVYVNNKGQGVLGVETAVEHSAPVNIYPNPTSGKITLDGLPLDENVCVEIYNLSGVLVDKFNTNAQTAITYNFAEHQKGIYFIRLTSNLYNSTLKVIHY